MNLEQIRARLAEIAAAVEKIVAGPEGYTADQVAEIDKLNGEFDSLSAQATTLERVESMKTAASTPNARKVVAATPGNPAQPEVVRSATDKFGGFKSSGDFLMAVKQASTGKVDQRLVNVTGYEKNGEDGGFLVPEDMSTEILKKLESKESLLESTRQFKMSGNSLSLNIDETQPWNSGVQAYWTAEGAPITTSKPGFKQCHLRLHKLAALVPLTDELLEDATAIESYVKTSAPEAIMAKLNDAIISGNGAGKPQGILASPFTVTASKESGQTADTIVAANIIKMYSRLFPQARAEAKWYINAGAEEQLNGLKDPDGNYIYLGPGMGLNQSPYGVLLGRPVVPMMSAMPALGDLGDIMFGNLKYYYSGLKAGGVKSAQSIHLYFDREITAFRFSLRVDGKVPFVAPVTTQYGSYNMSAFVILEAR